MGISDALVTEMKVQQIITRQESTGVSLDVELCESSISLLGDMKEDLYLLIRPSLGAEIIPLEGKVPQDMIWKERDFVIHKGEHNFVKKIYNKNGSRVPKISEYCLESGLDFGTISGPFSRIRFEEPKISKRQKLCQQLIKLGWKPEYKTEKGSPKLTHNGEPAPSLEKISGDLGKNLSKWFIASHRQSQIEGWLKRVRVDGRISAGCNVCSTNTGRSKHRGVANVPKAADSVFFGKEMRSCFRSTPGYKFVGWDASGLEARVAAHYTYPIDDGKFAREILDGDVHQGNADHFKIERSTAKSIFYGLCYGAQSGKVKEILGCSKKEAERVFAEFWKVNYSLGKVRSKCINSHNRNKYVPGLDGRKLFTRSEHSAMNTLFQGAGATIMSLSIVIMDELIKSHLWKSKPEQVIFYHDELQYDYLLEEEFHKFEPLPDRAIKEAGNRLGLRVELAADTSLGLNWAETH